MTLFQNATEYGYVSVSFQDGAWYRQEEEEPRCLTALILPPNSNITVNEIIRVYHGVLDDPISVTELFSLEQYWLWLNTIFGTGIKQYIKPM